MVALPVGIVAASSSSMRTGVAPGYACERRNNTENANKIGAARKTGVEFRPRAPSIAPHTFKPHRLRDRPASRVCGRTALRRLWSKTIGRPPSVNWGHLQRERSKVLSELRPKVGDGMKG